MSTASMVKNSMKTVQSTNDVMRVCLGVVGVNIEVTTLCKAKQKYIFDGFLCRREHYQS